MTLRNYSSTAAQTTLSGGVDASVTTLTVSATTGFPATPFVLAIDAGAAAQELVLVTNVAGTTLTVTRAFDSTVASSHDTGAVVAHGHAALDFREANTHVNATSGVHGATGAIVGTSDSQTLTNKSVALGSNTVTGTKAQFNTAMTDADFVTTTDPSAAWVAYSPAKVGFASSTQEAYYKKIDRTVHVSYCCILSGTPSGVMTLGLPVPAARIPVAQMPLGIGVGVDAGSAIHNLAVTLHDVDEVTFFPNASGFAVSPTVPFTWASGDTLSCSFTYEAA